MNILDRIVESKRDEVDSLRRRMTAADFRSGEYFRRPVRSLRESLLSAESFGIIAEIKRASPGAGEILPSADPASIAAAYEFNGAAGISVLTDAKFFHGSVHDLTEVRQSVGLPLLRKDFIVDELQVLEAKASGADAILLIAAILDKAQLADLFSAAAELGLECLVELYDEKEIDILDFDRMKLVGVNNRNLRSFEVDLNRSIAISRLIPANVTLVSESGIAGPTDIERLRTAGIRAALIGEFLMRSADPGQALRNLLKGDVGEAKD